MSDLLARLRIEGDASGVVAAGGQAERALSGVRQEATQAGQALGGADRQAAGYGRAATTAAGAADRLDRELGQSAASAGRAAQGYDRAADRAQHLDRSAAGARGALGLLGGAMALVGGTAFAREITDAGQAAAGLVLGMGAVTGGAANARNEMSFAADEADRLGLVAQDATKSMVGLAGSTNKTALMGSATREIWLGVSEAGMALGRSNEEIGRGLEAVSQIAGKGVVSMEEVRQQLAEAIPGAVQIGARAMGMTTQEFDKLVSSGKLAADVFLPKFAAQLREEYGPAIEAYLETPMGKARVEMARFETQTQRLQAASGQSFMAGLTDGLARLNAELGDAESLARAEALGTALAEGLTLAADAAIFLSDHLDTVVAGAEALAGVALIRWLTTASAEARAAAAAFLMKGQAARIAAAEVGAGAAQEVVAANSIRAALTAAAQAEVRSAEAALAATAAEVEATTARLAAAEAAQARALAETRVGQTSMVSAASLENLARAEAATATAQAEATAATNAHTVALERQQAADAGLARSKSALGLAANGAKGAMSGLLALVGGPWGAAFLAAGAAVYYLVKAHEAEEAKGRELREGLAKARAEYAALDAAKVALGKTTGDVISSEDQAAAAAANLAGEVDKLADAHYRAAAAAQYHALEALKLKAVESRTTADEAIGRYNERRRIAASAERTVSTPYGSAPMIGGSPYTAAGDARARNSEEYQEASGWIAVATRAQAEADAAEARIRDGVDVPKPTGTSTGGAGGSGGGKGRRQNRTQDVLDDLKLEAEGYRTHAEAALKGEAALDAWQIAEAGRQAVARAGLEPTDAAAAAIRKEAEETERLGLQADRIAAAASLERQARADAAALERRATAAAGGKAAVEALRVSEAGLEVLSRQRIASLDQLNPQERAAIEAAMRAAEAKERQAIATEKAEAAASTIEDLDRQIAAETRRTASIGAGAKAEIDYARAEFARQAVERAGLEVTDEAAAAIMRKAEALFAATAAGEASQDADDWERSLRLMRLSNREREIALRTERLVKDILAQQRDLALGTAQAQAEARARAEAWAEDWAKATGEVAEGMREQFIESGDLAFDDMGKALERQLRAAIYKSFLEKPINLVVNTIMGGAQNALGSLFGQSSGGGLGGLLGQSGGLGGMLGTFGQVAAIAAISSSLSGSIAGAMGGNSKKASSWGGVLGVVPGLIAGLTDKADRPYARADVEVQNGRFVLAGSQSADGGDREGMAAAGKALADQLNALSKTLGIDLSKVENLYTTIGKTEGGNAKALGGDGFFGGAINGLSMLDGARDLKGWTLGAGVGFSQGQDAEKITEQIIRDTLLRAINAGASDLSEAEKRFVAAAESLDQAIDYIQKSRGFSQSIEDAILQFTDPAAYEKKKALDAIEESYQALKTQAQQLVAEGLVSADVLGRIDALKNLQVEDALKKLAGSADDAATALARARPGLLNWLDRQMLSDNAPLNPLEQRNEAFRQYESVLTRALGGDAEAIGDLTSYAERLLAADRTATSDASARAMLFEEVMADVRALAATPAADPVTAAINALGDTLNPDPVVNAIYGLPEAIAEALGQSSGQTSGIGASLSGDGLSAIAARLDALIDQMASTPVGGSGVTGWPSGRGPDARLDDMASSLKALVSEVRTQNAYARQAQARVS